MVVVTDLCKTFEDRKAGPVRAVDKVNFRAEPGQVFGLLGVNGAGKTTCLRVLATILGPTSGTGSIAGHDIQAEPLIARRSLGFLSASTALYGRLTPLELLDYFGRLFDMGRAERRRRSDELVDRFGIAEFADRHCEKLSTGQKQRVNIARAIFHDPQVLFFDEPTAGLDVVTAQSVLEFIEDSKDSGKTVVFSTHVMSEAERLCDRLTVIHGGRAVWGGNRQEFLASHGHGSFESAFLTCVGYSRGQTS